MVRFVLIEKVANAQGVDDPGLKAVQDELDPKTSAEVWMIHDTAAVQGQAGAGRHGLVQAIETLDTDKTAKIESIDLVGHGAPGALSLGMTSAGSEQLQNGPFRDWTLLDTDVDKFHALSALAEKVRELKETNRLAGGFCVRLLGCNTAVDPGIVPVPSLTSLHDGAVLIHMLASFLDVEVVGTLGYIGAEDFQNGVFAPAAGITRTCTVDPDNCRVDFVPAQVLPGPQPDIAGGPTLKIQGFVPRKHRLQDVLTYFEDDAVRLNAQEPLVIRDATVVDEGGRRVDIVEQGKALLVRIQEGSTISTFRSRLRPGAGAKGFRAVIELVQDLLGRPPEWASRTPSAPTSPSPTQLPSP